MNNIKMIEKSDGRRIFYIDVENTKNAEKIIEELLQRHKK